MKIKLTLCLLLISSHVFALEYINRSHSYGEVALDQGIVFLGHTIGYVATQYDTVKEEGSWTDYNRHFLKFKFDNDNTTWNFIGHTYTGSQVYLFYRAKGYAESKAFFYSFLSSLYFEVFIETYTENPSFQDTFNTPFFGSSLGYVLERASVNFLKSDSAFLNGLGRVINPFSFLVKDNQSTSLTPVFQKDSYALVWSYRL